MTKARTCVTATRDRLRSVGLRPTRQRLALAHLLFDRGDRHVTAESLHGQAVEQDIKVSLATVYNTLHQFTAAELLREVVVDSGVAYFDTNTTEHFHVFYEDEGRLVDLDQGRTDLRRLLTAPKGSSIARVDVVLRVRKNPS